MLPFLDRVREHPISRRAQHQAWFTGRHLELGSGSGEFIAALSDAIGLELDPVMLQAAQQRHAGLRLCRGDVHALPFPAACFDSCRAERVLIHVADPGRVIAEAHRVLRPDGLLHLLESDLDTLLIDSPYTDVTRRILTHKRSFFQQPDIGRRLYGLLLSTFTILDIEPHTAIFHTFQEANFFLRLRDTALSAYQRQIVTATEAITWLNDLKSRPFFASITGFSIVAQR